MVNAQEYLNKNYPQENRKDIKELDFHNLNLEGDLDLKDFVNLENVDVSNNAQLGKIDYREKTVIKMTTKDWRSWRLCHKEKIEIIELNNWKDEEQIEIEGELIINDYPCLEEIVIQDRKNLTKLRINNCPQLTKLNCHHSKFTELTITNCSKLKVLDIRNNNFSQDLSLVRHLVSLEELHLGNNHFTGSLKPLQNLKELRELDISNTDISYGLEYLHESVKWLYCPVNQKKEAKVKVIYQLFDKEQGVAGIENCGYIKNFPAKLLTYKQKKKKNQEQEDQARKLLKDELQTYKQQIEELKIKKEETEERIDNLEIKLLKKKIIIEEIQEMIECWETNYNNLQEKTRQEISQIQEQRDNQLLINNKVLQEDLTGLEKKEQEEDREMKVDVMEETVEQLKKELKEQNFFVQSEKKSLEEKLTKSKEELEKKDDEISNLNQQIKNSRQNYENLAREKEKSTKLRLSLAQQERKFAEKENAFQNQIIDLQNEKQALISNLTEQLKQNKLINQQVQTQINQLKQDKISLQDRLTQTEIDAQNLKNQQKELQKQKEQLESQLAQSQDNYQKTSTEAEEKKQLLQVLLISQKNTEFANKQVEERIKSLEKELDQLASKLTDEEQIKKELEETLQLKESKMNDLEQKLINLDQERIKQLKTKEQELEKIKQKLQDELVSGGSTAEIHKKKEAKQKELNEVKQELEEVEGKQVIKKTEVFLEIKKQFINFRQGTIQNCKNFYNEFEKSGKKYAKLAIIGNMVSGASGVANTVSGGIAGTPIKVIGGGITAGVNIFKGKSLDKCIESFQDCLLKDEKNINLFDECYNDLVRVIWSNNSNIQGKIVPTIINILDLAVNKSSPFSQKHSVFNTDVSGIWKGRSQIKLEEVKNAILSLSKDLHQLEQEFQQEEDQLIQKNWFVEEGQLDKDKNQLLQTKIEIPPK